ncbi:MAG: DUF1559 domain-containing protein [Armatimonadota bacterium]
MHRKHGFTLIELLVVIAIIAILASILFPVFSRARAKARQSKCMANLKQLGLAFSMYSQDYDELLPCWAVGAIGNNDNGPAQGAYTWDTQLMPYMRNREILLCPDSPYGKTSEQDGGLQIRSYAMTRYTGDAWQQNNATSVGFQPCPIDYPPRPAETVLLTEKGNRGIGIVGDAAAETAEQSHGCTGFGLETRMYHNEGKMFLYLDGHVKWSGRGSGPFAADYGESSCPGSGGNPPGYTGDPPLEPHGPGHFEFHYDWPQ